MTSRVDSVGLSGISGYPVMVECSISSGLPGFELVGLPDAAVRESRERVRAAIKNSGFRFPVSRITLNLAPAGTKKTGTLYDLPILLGILAAQELVRLPREPSAFLGELSLEGKLRPVNGVLPMAIAARKAGIRVVYYILPTIWAWHKSRGKTIAKYTDLAISLFPFEAKMYEDMGTNVIYVLSTL